MVAWYAFKGIRGHNINMDNIVKSCCKKRNIHKSTWYIKGQIDFIIIFIDMYSKCAFKRMLTKGKL